MVGHRFDSVGTSVKREASAALPIWTGRGLQADAIHKTEVEVISGTFRQFAIRIGVLYLQRIIGPLDCATSTEGLIAPVGRRRGVIGYLCDVEIAWRRTDRHKRRREITARADVVLISETAGVVGSRNGDFVRERLVALHRKQV